MGLSSTEDSWWVLWNFNFIINFWSLLVTFTLIYGNVLKMSWASKNPLGVSDLNNSNFPPPRVEKGAAGCKFNIQSQMFSMLPALKKFPKFCQMNVDMLTR